MLGSFIHREQYSLDLIPFDGDLLSMESESAFKVRARLSFKAAASCWLLESGSEALKQQKALQSKCILVLRAELSLNSSICCLTKRCRNSQAASHPSSY